MKPILFNTEMVRALLEGRKFATRRVVKPQPEGAHCVIDCDDEAHTFDLLCGNRGEGGIFLDWAETVKAPFWTGDILYVRETWCQYGKIDDYDRLIDGTEEYYYRADGENPTPFNDFLVQHPGWDEHRGTPVWHPSIHMPKEAARLFLRVTDVRVERLQEITEEQARAEGAKDPYDYQTPEWYEQHGRVNNYVLDAFAGLWDSTIKPADRDRYGWAANPWVWVIEFERIIKETALQAQKGGGEE